MTIICLYKQIIFVISIIIIILFAFFTNVCKVKSLESYAVQPAIKVNMYDERLRFLSDENEERIPFNSDRNAYPKQRYLTDKELEFQFRERNEICPTDNTEDVYFESVNLPEQFSGDLLVQTKNYKLGIFNNIGFTGQVCKGISFKNMVFIRCSFYQNNMENVNFENCKFINCSMEDVVNLTIDQIRTTWNYQNYGIKELRLPKHLQLLVEQELKKNYSIDAERTVYSPTLNELHEINYISTSAIELRMGRNRRYTGGSPNYLYKPSSGLYGYTEAILANGNIRDLNDGANFHNCYIPGQIFARNCQTLKNIDFSGAIFESCVIQDVNFINCSFKGSVFIDCDVQIKSNNSDFSDALFVRGYPEISYEIFVQTRNFKIKKMGWDNISSRVAVFDYPVNADMTNFEIIGYSYPATIFYNYHCAIDFTNTYFENYTIQHYLPEKPIIDNHMSEKQFLSTKNYKMGVFWGIDFFPNFSEMTNFRNALFVEITPYKGKGQDTKRVKGTPSNFENMDITNAKFINCDLCNSYNLTVEQIKSTWNYKNNRMDLIKLPPDLQKYFDEEKKEKE